MIRERAMFSGDDYLDLVEARRDLSHALLAAEAWRKRHRSLGKALILTVSIIVAEAAAIAWLAVRS